MIVRALFSIVAIALLSPAAAASAPSHDVWRAVAVPPRPGLPTVTIDLGYPGAYISPERAPITLHAVAGDLAFDGFIGFHFAVNNARTFNVPIISRVVLRPHQSWSIATEADVRYFGKVIETETDLRYFGKLKREIVIEWRDRSMNDLATRRAGIPPWSTQARRLRVIASGEAWPALLSGADDSVERADALSDMARWYMGFRSLIVPLSVWLDLPLRVRQAIFGSGIYITFSGLPATGQRMDAIDRALLPVVFESHPGSYEIPWPYRTVKAGAIPVAMSWTAAAGAARTGSSPMPYIVSNQVAAWVADDAALTGELPAMWPSPVKRDQGAPFGFRVRPPAVRDFVRSFFPLLATIFIALAAALLWIMMRRSPRPAMAIAGIALSAAILFSRDLVRGTGETGDHYALEMRSPVAPGVTEHFTIERTYGPSPIPAKPASAELLRTAVTNGGHMQEQAEIRDAVTAAGWGTMVRGSEWDVISRWSERRELGEAPVIHVRQRDAGKLVVEYESVLAVDRVSAEWVYGDTLYFGGTTTSGGKHGVVTIENGLSWWSVAAPGWWDFSLPAIMQEAVNRCYTRVSLHQKKRSGTQIVEWLDPFPGAGRKSASFNLGGRLEGAADGTSSRLFALPVALIPTAATALIRIPKGLAARDVTVSWATGSIKPAPAIDDAPFDDAFAIPPDVFRQIAHEGGMLKVTLRPTHEGFNRATVRVLEKQP